MLLGSLSKGHQPEVRPKLWTRQVPVPVGVRLISSSRSSVVYFYVRTCVKFMFANKIEAIHERSLVSVKVEPRSTSLLSSARFFLPLFYLPD